MDTPQYGDLVSYVSVLERRVNSLYALGCRRLSHGFAFECARYGAPTYAPSANWRPGAGFLAQGVPATVDVAQAALNQDDNAQAKIDRMPYCGSFAGLRRRWIRNREPESNGFRVQSSPAFIT